MTTEEKLKIIQRWTYSFDYGQDRPPSEGRWYGWLQYYPTHRFSIHTNKWNTYEEMIDHAFYSVNRFWWNRINMQFKREA